MTFLHLDENDQKCIILFLYSFKQEVGGSSVDFEQISCTTLPWVTLHCLTPGLTCPFLEWTLRIVQDILKPNQVYSEVPEQKQIWLRTFLKHFNFSSTLQNCLLFHTSFEITMEIKKIAKLSNFLLIWN